MPRKKRIIRQNLPAREMGICTRLRVIRERLMLSQSAAAEQLGITRERLASYEDGRVSVKADFALRFCRQMVVSEEWLALGDEEVKKRHAKKFHLPAPQKPFLVGSGARKCMSLIFDPICTEIKKGMLFSEAWDSFLESAWNKFYSRAVFSFTDNEQLIRNYFHAQMEKWTERSDKVENFRLLWSLSRAADEMNMQIEEGYLTTEEKKYLVHKGVDSGQLSLDDSEDPKKVEDFLKKETPKYFATFSTGLSEVKSNFSEYIP